MARQTTIRVLAQDFENTLRSDAKVEARFGEDEPFRALKWTAVSGRFEGTGKAGAKCVIRVTPADDEWFTETRRVTLGTAPADVTVTLGPKTASFFRMGREDKRFFNLDDDRLMLVAVGRDVERRLVDYLREKGIGPVEVYRDSADRGADGRVSAFLPKSQGDAVRQASPDLSAKHQIEIRVGVPAFAGKSVFAFTNEVAVRFSGDARDRDVQSIARRRALRPLRRLTYVPNGWLLGAERPHDTAKLSEELRGLDQVVWAEPNVMETLVSDAYTPNDFLFGTLEHLHLVRAHEAWDQLDDHAAAIGVPVGDLRSGSPDITVAVFDVHGVSPTHPDLTGTLSDGSTRMVENYNFVTNNTQTDTALGGDHGTECASSAVGAFDDSGGVCGVAGNCGLIGARLGWTNSDIADGWIWAAGFDPGFPVGTGPAMISRTADVISNSWGASWGTPLGDTIREALDFLATYGRDGRGTVVCFSVGNLGYVQFSNVRTYAAYDKTIAIGASVDSNPTNPVPNASSVDPISGSSVNVAVAVDTRALYSPFGPELDIVAPSHTAYDGVTGAKVDPVPAAVIPGGGDWIGSVSGTTSFSAAAGVGDTVLNVTSTAGLAVGSRLLVRDISDTNHEFVRVVAVGTGQVTVTPALANSHPTTTVVATGPNHWSRLFGGTSHSCPMVAGAAALLLSVRPELNWVQVRDILRDTAEGIDFGQAHTDGQWVDNNGDGVNEFSQWYGYGRLNVEAAVDEAINWHTSSNLVVRENFNDVGAVPSPGWHAHSPDIWVTRDDDPIPVLGYADLPPHESVLPSQDNFVFLRVKNVGDAVSSDAWLRVLITHFPGLEFRYPQEWVPGNAPGTTVPSPLVPGSYLIGEEQITGLAPGEVRIVKIRWDQALIPPEKVMVDGTEVRWHPCLLAEASPHDGPAAATGHSVQRYSNIAQHNISIAWDEESTSGDSGLAMVGGTALAAGVDALIIDRSDMPKDIRLFIRAADPRMMKHWQGLVLENKVSGAKPLPDVDSPSAEAGTVERPSSVITVMDATRLRFELRQGPSVVIHAAAESRIEILADRITPVAAKPHLVMGKFRGKRAVEFRQGRVEAIRLPFRLPGGQFIPLVFGLVRGRQRRKPSGRVRITQVLTNGQLSPGATIELS